jgi:hypothetical protein
MKHIKTFEFYDKTITDGVFTIGDLVHINYWDDAKILKVYDELCLVEFEDKFQTTIKKEELTLFTPEEIKQYNLEQSAKKYNL